MVKVKKRDGNVVDFLEKRIIAAISKAEFDVENTVSNMGESIADLIHHNLKAKNVDIVSVEEIQDMVVDHLTVLNAEVALAYKDYREEHSVNRSKDSELIKSIMGLIDCTNEEVLSENSNKQAQLVSTQRDLIAGEVSKHIAKTKMLPKHLVEAHERGEIKLHDLDYVLQPIYNCELVNLKDMLQNGTVINKKKINKPKSLRTAMTIVTQIAAQVASSTYGK